MYYCQLNQLWLHILAHAKQALLEKRFVLQTIGNIKPNSEIELFMYRT